MVITVTTRDDDGDEDEECELVPDDDDAIFVSESAEVFLHTRLPVSEISSERSRPRVTRATSRMKKLENEGIKRKPPSLKKRPNYEPKVPIHQRIQEYPDEYLTERAGKLYCSICSIVLKLKKTVIDNHVKSRTHGIKKEKAILTDSGGGYQALLNVTLHEERKQEEVAGLVSRLSTETEEYRCKIAYAYILDRVPFENLDSSQGGLRKLLEQINQELRVEKSETAFLLF
jgi:hypothetical protein